MVKRLALAGLLLSAFLASLPTGASAATCTLTATLDPGHSIALAGSGFAAGASVTLDISRNGTPDGSQTLQAGASGAFASSIDAGPGLGGRYTFTATSAGCTATVEAVAVETAGGVVGGTRPTQPPTDVLPITHRAPLDQLPLGTLALVAAASLLALGLLRLRTGKS